MTLTEFRSSLDQNTPPSAISDLLKAMWYDGKGDWNNAHDIAQDIHTTDGSWIHAYLHRKEGDSGNALYWYQKAGRSMPRMTLEQEWEQLVNTLLSK